MTDQVKAAMTVTLILLLTTLVSGCATEPSYDQKQKRCFKIMEESGVPRCADWKRYEGWDESEIFFDLGNSNGFLEGCIEALDKGEE